MRPTLEHARNESSDVIERFRSPDRRRWHVLLAGVITLACSSSGAMSRMGTAQVNDSDGVPCFSLPENGDTKSGLLLQTLYVSETRLPDNGLTLPAELWHIRVEDARAAPLLRPHACIRYGQAPAATMQRTLKKLELFHPYHVAIRTKADHSGVVAYSAEFCLRRDRTGQVRVVVVPRTGGSDDERFSVCART